MEEGIIGVESQRGSRGEVNVNYPTAGVDKCDAVRSARLCFMFIVVCYSFNG